MPPRREHPSEPEYVAHHEAGHAVAAIALGCSVVCVSIVPGDGRRGVCVVAADDDAGSRAAAEREVTILLAGGIAGRRFAGRWSDAGECRGHLARLAR